MNIYNDTLPFLQEHIIYKATNIVNKDSYIGYSGVSLKARQDRHKSDSFNKNCKEYNLYFHRAIRSYGWDNFKWEIIYTCYLKYFTLNIMEPFYIKFYETYTKDPDYKGGYNMTPGGNKGPDCTGRIHTEEEKRKMSEASKGKPKSDEHRDNMSLSYIIIYEDKEEIIINLRRYCDENDLNYNYMSAVANGKKIQYKGYRVIKIDGNITPKEPKPPLKYLITFPDGHEEIIFNLNKFCRKHNLHVGCMRRIIKGSRKSHKEFKVSLFN